MTIQDELLWLEERLRAMSPNINLNEGSPANVQVLQPFVRRFKPDPLESSMKDFILGRLRQEYPNLTAEEGDALTDLVVKPMTILLEPFRREIRSVKRNQSIADPSIVNADEADAILNNTFFRRNLGQFSRGKVRIYFANPVTLSLGSANVAYTSGGRRYLIATPQSITSEAMMLNMEGTLYYWDVDYVAEASGKAYDVPAGSIIGVTGIASATKATNPYKFSGGITEESTTALVARAEESISERSLNTVPGAVAKLFEEFGDLKILQIIGFNDEEMERDVITGGSLGDVYKFGIDGIVAEDGDLDGYSPYFDSAGSSFTTDFGPVGTTIDEYVLTIWIAIGSPLVITPLDFQLGTVISTTRLKINSSYTHDERLPLTGATYWTIRKRQILLSDIPGGILFPDTNGNELIVEPNKIHVGGCSDYYVNGGTQTEATLALTSLADRDPVVKGLLIQTYDGSSAAADRLDITMTVDEYDELVEGKTMVRILDTASGNNIGIYRIIHKVQYLAGVAEVVIDTELVAPEESGVYGDVVEDIDVELNAPYEVVVEGDDLRTYAGTPVVDTASGTIFTSYGMPVGPTDNVLMILSGNDEGTYTISSVAAASLTLSSNLSDTTGPLPYRVVRKLSSAGIQLPLRRIRNLELLDTSSQPTGDFVPYRHPVDVQSRTFANIGRSPKAGSSTTYNDTLTAVTGSDEVTSSYGAMNYWNAGVRVNDVININTSDNQGNYLVVGVGGGPGPIGTGLSNNQLRLNEPMAWSVSNISYEVGEPSVGSFRVYFLDPCTAEVTSDDTRFSVPVGNTSRTFRPDPAMDFQFLPTENTVPTASLVPSANITLYTPDGASGVNAWLHGIQVGDYAEITYAPITGCVDLTAGVGGLSGRSLLLDLGSGPERVTFAATGVLTGAEIVSQINAQLSSSIASVYTDPATSLKHLMFRADFSITLLDNIPAPGAGDATALLMDGASPNSRATFMPWLSPGAGDFANRDTVNDSHVKGKWIITAVNPATLDRSVLTLGANAAGTLYAQTQLIPATRGHYVRISRYGLQRISALDMADNRDELGLYYWDVECTSEGHGNSWNIAADIVSTITGYYSEGWEMSVEDDTVSYSMAEAPWIHLSPRILLTGTDDPSSYTTLLEESVQIDYEQEDIVAAIHSFVRSPSERVVNNNPLVRGLTPTMIRTFIAYTNGPSTTIARAALVDLIASIMPNQFLEVSDMVQILTDRGATYVNLPITLIGISHRVDRSLVVERSKDLISNDRLSVLVPDDDGTTTEGASFIALSKS